MANIDPSYRDTFSLSRPRSLGAVISVCGLLIICDHSPRADVTCSPVFSSPRERGRNKLPVADSSQTPPSLRRQRRLCVIVMWSDSVAAVQLNSNRCFFSRVQIVSVLVTHKPWNWDAHGWHNKQQNLNGARGVDWLITDWLLNQMLLGFFFFLHSIFQVF